LTQLSTRGRAPNDVTTGSKVTDDTIDGMWGPNEDDDDSSGIKKMYDDAIKSGYFYSVGRAALSAAKHGGFPRGFEGEVGNEMAKRTGRIAQGFWVPWNAPIAAERRSLTVATAAGSVTGVIPYKLMIDVLRPKLAIARLGGHIINLLGDGPKGTVQLPSKSAASTISWVTEGNAPASESNLTVPGFTLTPRTATAYTDLTRRMLKLGGPEFQDHVINDIMTGLSVAIDGAAFNGPGVNGQPLGLFQFPGLTSVSAHGDTGNGGTITHANLVAMNEIVGIYNGDSPATARMGWVGSPQCKSTLALTDKSATVSTGRFCWEAHPCIVDGQVVTVEHIMGYPAVATTNAPSNGTEGTSTTITSLVHGNFDDCLVNLFSGFDCVVNPFLQSTTGVIRISGFQDCDVRFLHGGASFCLCSNILAIAPQIS
jgi:HK97 family phage major capsid protein